MLSNAFPHQPEFDGYNKKVQHFTVVLKERRMKGSYQTIPDWPHRRGRNNIELEV